MKIAIAHGRAVEEWVGETADTPIPNRVRVRVFDRLQGRCGQCGRKIGPTERWTLEHVTALCNGGQNREANLSVTCSWCLPIKNAEDVAQKATTYRKRSKHLLGRKAKGRPMPGSRLSNWKRCMDGTTVRRTQGDQT